jgi:bifunctional DNase/RNase
MANIEMVIDSIRVSLMNYQRVVILKEKEGERYLPCYIGPAEADAIAVKMQGVYVPRPLTHDFTCAAIDALGGSVQSVIINKLEKDTFYAKVVLKSDRGQMEIDCRPSDALAVAVRKGVPVFADDKVLKKAGVLLDAETGKPLSEPSSEGITTSQKPSKGRLETFSESVQDILDTAEAEAKRLNCSYVCTGHLLLALLKEMNTATEVMKNAGVNLTKIQLHIETLMKEEHGIEGGGTGLTPAVKETIQTSIAEAKRLGSEKVLPEHILLGLMRASDGIAAGRLKNAGIAPETIYVELIRLYTGTRRWHEGQ